MSQTVQFTTATSLSGPAIPAGIAAALAIPYSLPVGVGLGMGVEENLDCQATRAEVANKAAAKFNVSYEQFQ